MKMPPAHAEGFATHWCWRLLFAVVVFVAINLARHFVVLVIDFGFFRRSQFSTIGSAVPSDLAVYSALFTFQVGGFAGGQLAALDALSDAVLLIFGAFANFRVGSLQCGLSDDWQGKRCQSSPEKQLLDLPVHRSSPLSFVFCVSRFQCHRLLCMSKHRVSRNVAGEGRELVHNSKALRGKGFGGGAAFGRE